MAIEVTMPQMGADMAEGVVVRWLKQVGDPVERGDILAEIETDKATVELEAFDSGTLLTHLAAEGETVPVGDVIAMIGTPGEESPSVNGPRRSVPPLRRPSSPAAASAVLEAERNAALPDGPPAVALNGGSRLRISPVARRIAVDAGIDVRSLRGTGPDGRILKRDVEAALGAGAENARVTADETDRGRDEAASAPAPEPTAADGTATVPLTRMRRAIARRMVQAKHEQPHYYITVDVDMTAAVAFREQFNALAGEGARASFNDLIVKACALALTRHPRFNSRFTEDGIRLEPSINISIGVALEEGLIAPAVLDCGARSLGGIAAATRDLVARAREGRLTATEYGDGTFTVTNLGAFGVESLIGIINPPQAAILGVGELAPRPAVRDGELVIRSLMKLALSADHRVTDGAEGARFLKEVQGFLEKPAALAL